MALFGLLRAVSNLANSLRSMFAVDGLISSSTAAAAAVAAGRGKGSLGGNSLGTLMHARRIHGKRAVYSEVGSLSLAECGSWYLHMSELTCLAP